MKGLWELEPGKCAGAEGAGDSAGACLECGGKKQISQPAGTCS